MKNFTLFSFAIIAWFSSVAQKVEWADFVYSTVNFNPGMGVAADATGNVYVLGEIQDQIIIQADTFTNQYGGKDLILIKYTGQGNFLWAKVFGSSGADDALDLAIDDAGNLYAASLIQGQTMMSDTTYTASSSHQVIQFDTTSNFRRYINKTAPILVDAIGTDVYLAYRETVEKLDTAFTTIWNRTGSSNDMTFSNYGPQGSNGSIMVGNNGHLVVSGLENATGGTMQFDTVAITFGPGYCNELFVMSMDTSGAALWVKTLDTSTTVEELVPEVAVDDAGNVYFALYSEGDTIRFANDTLYSNPSTTDYSALLKYDAAGVPQWAVGFYASGFSHIYDMLINPAQEVIFCGYSTGSGQLGNYVLPATGLHLNPYVAKVDAAGVVQWYKTDEIIATGTSSFYSIAPTPDSSYAVTGFYPAHSPDAYQIGCFSATTSGRDIVTAVISEDAEPVAAFTHSNVGLTFTFTDQSTGAWSWDWDFGDGNTSTLQNPIHTYLATGNHVVTLYINDSLCASSGQTSVDTIDVGIFETQNLLRGTFIGTNPFTDFIDVFIVSPMTNEMRFELADVTGKVIKAGMPDRMSATRHRIDAAQLSNGIYFITLITDGHRKTMKAVKTE